MGTDKEIKTVVVTGCAGFIGNYLVRYLLNAGYRVIGIDDLSNGNIDYLPKEEKFIFFQFSLNISEIVPSVFEEIKNKYNPIALYHLAGNGYDMLSPFVRNYTYSNNILSYANVINQCIKYNLKIIFVSSLSVYGKESLPFNEYTPVRPDSPEAISKYAIELDILNASKQFNIRYNIVRLGNLIGIYQNLHNPYKSIFSAYCNNIVNNKDLLIYGNGHQKRSFLDIQYCLMPLEKLINEHDNEIFNIGADNYISIEKVADLFIEICNSNYNLKLNKKYCSAPEDSDIFCDSSKAKMKLNFEDKTDIREIIDQMIAWSMGESLKPGKDSLQVINYELNSQPYIFWPKSESKKTESLEFENKEYFSENSKRYRKSYG